MNGKDAIFIILTHCYNENTKGRDESNADFKRETPQKKRGVRIRSENL